jgi:hypothetical protein
MSLYDAPVFQSQHVTVVESIENPFVGSAGSIRIPPTGSTEKTTHATPGTFVTVTSFASDGENGPASAGVTPDYANNKLTVGADGLYKFVVTFTYTGAANTTYTFRVYNITAATHVAGAYMAQKVGSQGENHIGALHGLEEASADDEFRLEVTAGGAEKAFTILYASFSVEKVGD